MRRIRNVLLAKNPRGTSGWRRFLSPAALIVCLFIVASSGAAFGFWTTSANGSSRAKAITLNAPGAGSATSPTTTSLVISWGASSNLPASHGGYQVLRSTTSGSGYSAISSGPCNQSITEGSTATTCTDSGLTPGTTYYYEVVTTYFVITTLWTSAPTTQFSNSTPKVTPTITTQTSAASLTVGGSLTDQATVSGGFSPTGTITWKVYASTDTSCTTPLFSFTSSQTVTANNTYTSGSLTTTAAGSYIWGFNYTGDTSNAAVSACGGANESFTVNKATPALGTSATASVAVGGTVSDTATLTNGYNATGTITYTLYGPSVTQACATQVGQVTSTVVNGTTVYTSPNITPPSAGTYWWIANYGGNSNNSATTNTCGATGESSVVSKLTPTISTTTSLTTIPVGGSLTDTASVSGGFSPTGTITWHVYASTDTTCTTPLFSYTGTQTVNGNTSYSPTGSVTPTLAGSYIWGFSYNGDTNNNAATGCGGTNESFTVTKATPTISTTPSPSNVSSGNGAGDQATLSGGFGPLGGSISYTLFAPSDTNCTGTPTPLTASGSTVSGTGTYTSGNVQPTTVGTWHWIATYSGDVNNNAVSDPCSGTGSEPVAVFAADGSGTLTTPTTSVVASSTNTIVFTYTAAAGGMSSGEVDIAVPTGWTAPTASAASGCTTTSAGTLSFSGQTIKVTGLTLAATATLTVTYGATTGSACTSGDGGTATATTGAQTWQGQEKSTSAGTLTNITPSPSITVTAACGNTTFSLPANTTINFTLVGGGGGAGAGNAGSGGPGAKLTGTLKNTTGSAVGLTINVGCVGTSGAVPAGGTPGGAGYATGGVGGSGHDTSSDGGGGGGGATSVSITTGGTVLLVAGGGGGGGGEAGTGSASTSTSSSSTPATGAAGVSPGNSGGSAGGNGGGGGGGGAGTGGSNSAGATGGTGGFSYPASGFSSGGITVTVNTPTAGSNNGAVGSATL